MTLKTLVIKITKSQLKNLSNHQEMCDKMKYRKHKSHNNKIFKGMNNIL